MTKGPTLVAETTADSILKRQESRGALVLALILGLVFISRTFAPPSFGELRLRDFGKIYEALNAYKKDHGAFPVASFVTAYPNGVHSPNWIPGLAPKYLTQIPEDPRGSTDPTRQYMYASDGRDFKIIAHAPEDFVPITKKLPQIIDPRRPTWAYGIWTNGASSW